MYKKVTITMDTQIYEGVRRLVGVGHISAFLSELARPYIQNEALKLAYKEMASDKDREKEADEWSENLMTGVEDGTR